MTQTFATKIPPNERASCRTSCGKMVARSHEWKRSITDLPEATPERRAPDADVESESPPWRGSLPAGRGARSRPTAAARPRPDVSPARALRVGDASRSTTSLSSASDRVMIRLDERLASRQSPPEKFPKGGWLIVAVGLAPLFAFLWRFLPR